MSANDSYFELANHGESKNFLKTALVWRGSVSPLVLPRVVAAAAYASVITVLGAYFPTLGMPITPFEYSGAVLGLVLVLRMNAGVDRWWEARKIWGSIVNQSRNLAIIGSQYAPENTPLVSTFLHWTAVWPHVMRESLRQQRDLSDAERLLGKEETARIRKASHMPSYIGARVALLLGELRKAGLDDFAFLRAERERALLIDAIGACERIRNTPIPLVLAIKTRRFILILLLLLPIALLDDVGVLTPMVVALASYPLFCLDEIGAELQNPFSPRNLSHLPLNTVCSTIERDVLALQRTI